MFASIPNARISAVRAVVPSREIALADEIAFYGGSAKKIARLRETLGMDKRRVCPADVTASDLCAHAAEEILGADPAIRPSVDCLIFVSQMPDWIQPATACELQARLRLSQECAAFDVNQGCAGYVYGLWLSASLIASGAAKKVLLLVGDAQSFSRDRANRITAPVFGDGGSATLLIRDDTAPPLAFDLGTDGRGFENIIIPAGGARIPFVRERQRNEALIRTYHDTRGNPWQMCETYMDGGKVFNFTMDVVPPHLENLLRRASVDVAGIDLFLFHQANRQIVTSLAMKAGFPLEKVPVASFSRYGNTASASIPIALCDTFGATPVSGNMLLCGYGIGLSWASCICRLENVACAPVLDFRADPGRPTREQRIARWEHIFTEEEESHDGKSLS